MPLRCYFEVMLHSDAFTLRHAAKTSKSNESDEPEPHIFVDCWQGRSSAKLNLESESQSKVLLIVHGMGEHSGRYKHLPEFLGSEFERFYAMDLRGHGRSQGLRGYAPNFDSFIEDVLLVTKEVQARESGKRIYLLAHSFGGLIALRLLLREKKVPYSGVILSAPLLGITLPVPAYKKAMAKVLLHTLPKLQIINEVNPSHLSHDPEIVEAYVHDRLVHTKMTPRLYKDMTEMMEWVMSQNGPLAAPSLFLVPGDDRIVSSRKILEFYRRLKARDKQLREYPEMYHESLNEVAKEQVFSDIKSWLGNDLMKSAKRASI